MNKTILFFVTLLICTNARSQQLSDQLLHQPAPMKNLLDKKLPTDNSIDYSPETLSTATVEKKVNPDALTRFSFSFAGGINSQNYSLKGSGFNGTLSNESGYEYGIKTFYHSSDASKSLFLSLDRSEGNYSSPKTLTPSDIKVQKDYLFVGFSSYSFFEKSLGFKVGYGLVNQEATQTEPDSLISSYKSHGVLLGFLYKRLALLGEWGVSGDCSIYIPSSVSLENGNLGNRDFSYIGVVELMAFRNVSSNLQISLGIRSKTEQQKYSGQSSSGTNNAELNYQTFSLPIELRYSL